MATKELSRHRQMKTLAPLVISIAALVLSALSLYFQRQDYLGSRQVVLTGGLIAENPFSAAELSNVRFQPTDKDITVQLVNIIYPSAVWEEGDEFRGPEPKGDISVALHGLKDVLVSAIPRSGEPEFFWSCRDWLPVVFETDFIARGERSIDRSLYEMHFVSLAIPPGEFTDGGEYNFPQVTSFRFSRRLGAFESPRTLVDSILSRKRYQFREPGSEATQEGGPEK